MKLGDFVLDAASNVLVSKTHSVSFDYLDGAERYLHDLFLSSRDLGLLSAELKSKIRDWPSMYHLSPYRATILDCLDINNRDAKVLELGAGCGSITRWLGEHFNEVHSVEGSIQRASVARLRCRDLDNVKVYASNFYDLTIDKEFDLITLIGVLEYSNMYNPVHKNKPYEAALSTLEFIHNAIRENGILILAIENKFGLKYFSGAKEDHSGKIFDGIQGYSNKGLPVTFSSAELSELLLKAGFASADFFLPFPDYKLAKTIINSQTLASNNHYIYNWIETPFPDRVDGQRVLLFNESLALREITKAGLLKDMANSFLVVAHKGDKSSNSHRFGYSAEAWAARHYAMERHKAFCKRVTLCLPLNDAPFVEGEPVFSVQSDSIISPENIFSQKLSAEPFQAGDLLAFRIFEMIASGTFDGSFEGLLEEFHSYLINQYASGRKDSEGVSLLNGKAIDVSLWNIIENEQYKRWMVIDREWSFSGLIPADFILWRNLYHLFIRYKDYFGQYQHVSSLDEMAFNWLKKIYPSTSQDRANRSRQFDQAFQDFVNHGTASNDVFSITGQAREISSAETAPRDLSDKTTPLVSIIVPAYNNLDLTRQCLEAVRLTAGSILYEIIVVDDASSDGTSDYLSKEQTAGHIRTIANEKKLGFAKACNKGARAAIGKYVLFLNNDTIPQPGWLEELVRLAESDATIGVVGSKLLFPDGTIQHAGVVVSSNKLPYHIYRGLPGNTPCANKQRDYQTVTAACMLMSKELFTSVGEFDEQYINGCEDLDLCLKVRKKGSRVVYNPKSVLIHLEGKTEGRQDQMDYNRRLFLQAWGDKIKRDDIHILEQDGMKLRIGPDDSFTFIPSDKLIPLVTEPKSLRQSVIIVTFNSAPTIRPCLDSVLRYSPDAEVFVVDNASADDTRTILKEYESRITMILNHENKGFSFACNQGIRVSRGKFIILLNPDTMVTPMWAERILAHFKPGVGAVGPLSNYVAALQKHVMYCREAVPEDITIDDLSEKLYNWNCGQGIRTKLLVGFCIAFPRSVLDEVGLLDENLILGNDDLDISWRLRQRGYKLIIATDTFVYHKGQVSFKTKNKESAALLEESNRRFYEKLRHHYGSDNIPTPMELWGIDFFNPPGAHFRSFEPTFAALYIVHNETTWLKESFESIYNNCDAIFFLVSEKPWFGETTDSHSAMDLINALPDPEDKIRIESGSWQIEAEKRNRGMELIRKAGFTFAFIVDTDEIYDPVQLGRMKSFVAGHPEIDCWHISMYTYWKSYRYRIEPPESLNPTVFAKADGTHFTHIRDVDADSYGFLPPNIGICHHMSYAISDEAVYGKITLGSHAPEVQPGWFENVWKRWDADHSLTNLHPTHPAAYQRAIEQPYSALPPVLKKIYINDSQTRGDRMADLTSIVILAHNQWDQTERCLQSIEKHTPEPHEIILVDNGSTDETRERLKSLTISRPNLKVIINNVNRGFAAGNNQGLSIARGNYVLLLNNDTIVTPGWLGRMIDIFKQHPKTGIVGPMSNSVTRPQLIETVTYNDTAGIDDFAVRWTKEHEGQSFSTSKASGFCLLAKREVIEKIGGLDEQFGSGNFEDDDFCSRAFLSGFEIRIAQDVFIHHVGRKTFKGAGIDYNAKMLRNWEFYKAKWDIPKDAPMEHYWVPTRLPDSISHFFPLPDLSSDHYVDPENRWWEDMRNKEEQKKIRNREKERVKGLTSIIIFISQEREYARKCVESIQKNTSEPYEIIFVPSDSSYAPPKWLRKLLKTHPGYVLIKSDTNLNFAQAYNKGISQSRGEYITILHSAATVTTGWLTGMLECLNSSPDIAVTGPMSIHMEGPQGIPDIDYDPDHLDEFAGVFRETNRYRRVKARRLDSFCILFKHALKEEIGSFDESFETDDYVVNDFCARVAVEGYSNIIAGDVFIHYDGRRFLNALHDQLIFSKKWGSVDSSKPGSKKLYCANALFVADKLNQKGQREKAALTLVDGIKLYPDERKLHYALAEILIEGSKYADAVKALENMPDGLQIDAVVSEYLGACKVYLGLNEEADRYADEILLFSNASAKGWNLKGTVLFQKGSYADAEKAFQKAIDADRSFGEAYANIGALRWAAGNKDEALKYFQKAFILSPVTEDIVTNYYAAVVNLSKLPEAEKIFREAITLHPFSRRLKFILIDNLLQQKKFQEAMSSMEEAIATFGIDDNTLSAALKIRDTVEAALKPATAESPTFVKGGKEGLPNDRSTRNTLSVCMIVINEEDNIMKAIQSVKPVAGEIIVVDTGSTDRTKNIARAFGAKVYDFKWTDSFSDARNFSLSKASGDWIFVLDADEVISPADYEKLKDLVTPPPPPLAKRGIRKEALTKVGIEKGSDSSFVPHPSSFAAYSFISRNYVGPVSVNWHPNDGQYREEAGSGWFPSSKVRLFPNDSRIRFERNVHEIVEESVRRLGLEIRECDIPIHHYGKLNREDILAKGEGYYQLGKKKLALEGEQNANSLFELAMQASELEKNDEAVEYWKKLIDLMPGLDKAHYGLGTSYYRLGRYEEARAAYAKAMQIAPGAKDQVVMYATSELLAGNVVAAVSHLERLLKGEPAYPLAFLAITAAYFCAGRKDKGLEYAGKVEGTQFRLAPYLTDIAKLLSSVKRFDYAISLLDAAMETGNTTDETQALLDTCYKMQSVNNPNESPTFVKGGKGGLPDNRNLQGTISLCMIVKNEEENIERSLTSVQSLVDEMIVVDTGSTDKTKDIARSLGAKIYDFHWTDSFSDARNFSLSKASGKWILVLDADEVISPIDHERLRGLIAETSSFPSSLSDSSFIPHPSSYAYSFVTRTYVEQLNSVGWVCNDGHYKNEEMGTGWIPGTKVRLFPNDSRIRFEYPLHERVEPSLLKAGIEIRKCDVPIHHYGNFVNRSKTDSKAGQYYQLGKRKIAGHGKRNFMAYYELAIQGAELGKHEETVEYLKKVIALKPNFSRAYQSMGNAHYNLRNYEEALLYYKKAFELKPEPRDLRHTVLMYATCETLTGNADKAISLIETFIGDDISFPQALLLLAEAYFCLGREGKGSLLARNLRDMNYDAAQSLMQFSKLLGSTGRFGYAVSLLDGSMKTGFATDEMPALLAEYRKNTGIGTDKGRDMH